MTSTERMVEKTTTFTLSRRTTELVSPRSRRADLPLLQPRLHTRARSTCGRWCQHSDKPSQIQRGKKKNIPARLCVVRRRMQRSRGIAPKPKRPHDRCGFRGCCSCSCHELCARTACAGSERRLGRRSWHGMARRCRWWLWRSSWRKCKGRGDSGQRDEQPSRAQSCKGSGADHRGVCGSRRSLVKAGNVTLSGAYASPWPSFRVVDVSTAFCETHAAAAASKDGPYPRLPWLTHRRWPVEVIGTVLRNVCGPLRNVCELTKAVVDGAGRFVSACMQRLRSTPSTSRHQHRFVKCLQLASCGST